MCVGGLAFMSCQSNPKINNNSKDSGDLRAILNSEKQVNFTIDGNPFLEYEEYSVSDSTAGRHLEIKGPKSQNSELRISFDNNNRLVGIAWFNEVGGNTIVQSFNIDSSGRLIAR